VTSIQIPGPPGPGAQQPIGFLVARTGKTLDRAFDDALAAVGGNRPTWLILLAVKSGAGRTQSGIAARIGISGPTLTHHLDRLELASLVVRTRDPDNRRLQTISLTTGGDTLFFRLRDAAMAFDARLRTGVSSAELSDLRRLLTVLHDNIAQPQPTSPTGSAPPDEDSNP
jgi:MarR family transcriptional regulator for hemolysin